MILSVFIVILQLFTKEKMVLGWREVERESQDLDAANEPTTIQALRNYGLLKFFMDSRHESSTSFTEIFGHNMGYLGIFLQY